MESLSWRRILAALALAGLTTVMGATAWADTQAEGSAGVPAVWTAKELRFVYMGFTSHYSCDGLRDKIRVILTDFGARDDLQVSEGPCTDLGRPTRFPGVNIKINVLQPAGDATDSSVVAAHWKRVQLPGPGDAVRQAGDCELVEQVKQKILPLFSTRNVVFKQNCIPYQLTVNGSSLSLEVLKPTPRS